MQTLSHDGVELAYVEHGTGEPAMLMLHGMACVHEHMTPLIDVFACEHRCVAFDLRGHGSSGVPHDAYSTVDFTSDLGFVIDELGLDRPILIGHSFGGSVSLAFAAAHPDRVRALVMLDSGLRSKATVGADLNPFYDALRAATPEQYRTIVEEFCMTRLFDPVDDQVDRATDLGADGASAGACILVDGGHGDGVRQCRARPGVHSPSLIIQSCQPFVDPAALATLGPNWYTGTRRGIRPFHPVAVRPTR